MLPMTSKNTRRGFLRNTASLAVALGAAAPAEAGPSRDSAIARVEAFPINYAVEGHFKFFEGPRGRAAGRPAVVVKITTADGTVGWGQSVPA